MMVSPKTGFGRVFRAAGLALVFACAPIAWVPAWAQTPAAPAPATPPTATPAPVAPVAPAPTVPDASPPAATGTPAPSGDASTAQAITVPARPVALMRGSATWDNGFQTLKDDFSTITAEIAKAGLKPTGHPFTIFVETDDAGFRFEAMVPIAEIPVGKDALSADVKLATSPSGKAMKFEHRGAYDEIDSTYEAITAYLDEKNLEATNMFVEEYLTELKDSEDNGLQVDIYVFVK